MYIMCFTCITALFPTILAYGSDVSCGPSFYELMYVWSTNKKAHSCAPSYLSAFFFFFFFLNGYIYLDACSLKIDRHFFFLCLELNWMLIFFYGYKKEDYFQSSGKYHLDLLSRYQKYTSFSRYSFWTVAWHLIHCLQQLS